MHTQKAEATETAFYQLSADTGRLVTVFKVVLMARANNLLDSNNDGGWGWIL
jgi:hypothetical protein